MWGSDPLCCHSSGDSKARSGRQNSSGARGLSAERQEGIKMIKERKTQDNNGAHVSAAPVSPCAGDQGTGSGVKEHIFVCY